MAETRNKLDRAIELQERAKKFAIDIICAFTALPKTDAARVIGRQFLRSGTAVAASISPLREECEELLKIFSSSLATAKTNRSQ